MATSSSSLTSMVATVGVHFHADVTAFTELPLVVLDANQTVFLPIAEVLVVTVV